MNAVCCCVCAEVEITDFFFFTALSAVGLADR